MSFVKYVVLLALLLGVIGAGALLFHAMLAKALPPDYDQRLARESRVSAGLSLSSGEEIAEPGPPTLTAVGSGSQEAANLVVSVFAALDATRGATAVLTGRVAACPAGTLVLPAGLSLAVATKDESALASAVSRTFCVSVRTESVFSVRPVSGTWAAPSATELPELESTVQRLEYVAPDGRASALTVSAIGFCASEDGGCNSAITLSSGPVEEKPTAVLGLEDQVEVTLRFNAGGG